MGLIFAIRASVHLLRVSFRVRVGTFGTADCISRCLSDGAFFVFFTAAQQRNAGPSEAPPFGFTPLAKQLPARSRQITSLCDLMGKNTHKLPPKQRAKDDKFLLLRRETSHGGIPAFRYLSPDKRESFQSEEQFVVNKHLHLEKRVSSLANE